MEPIHAAALARRGRSDAMAAWARMSVNVVPAPMATLCGVLSMKRRSGMPQRLTSFEAGRRPAAWATINSVPPAIGVHLPGALGHQFENRGQAARRNQLVCLGITAHDHPTTKTCRGDSDDAAERGGGNDRLEDADESRASAEIAGEALADFRHVG